MTWCVERRSEAVSHGPTRRPVADPRRTGAERSAEKTPTASSERTAAGESAEGRTRALSGTASGSVAVPPCLHGQPSSGPLPGGGDFSGEGGVSSWCFLQCGQAGSDGAGFVFTATGWNEVASAFGAQQ